MFCWYGCARPEGRGEKPLRRRKQIPVSIFLKNDKKWHLWRAWGVGRCCPGDPDSPSPSSIHRPTPTLRYHTLWCIQTHWLATARETFISSSGHVVVALIFAIQFLDYGTLIPLVRWFSFIDGFWVSLRFLSPNPDFILYFINITVFSMS